MVMGKKVWAVMCGAIRQEFELFATLAMLCDYRSKELLEGIVISTWKGEVENIPGLREKLEQLDIYIVELEPLDEKLKTVINIGYARQAYQLKYGLDFVPNDVFILKCRTDYSIDQVNWAGDILNDKTDFTVGTHGALQMGVQYRIAVYWYPADMPFLLNDVGFVGYKLDLYKMVDFEMTILRYKSYVMPDLNFFLSIFKKQFPIFEQFFGDFDITLLYGTINGKIKKYLNEANEEQKRNFVFPNILNKLYAVYFVLLYNCFFPFCNMYCTKLDAFDITDVFACNKKVGMIQGWQIKFLNKETLRMIVEGECIPTKAYVKLYREINKIAVRGYAEKLCYDNSEIEEFLSWMTTVLKFDAHKFLRENRIRHINKNITDYRKAIYLLFDKYTFNDDVYKSIYTITHDRSDQYFYTLSEHIDGIRSNNENLYQSMLGSAGRSEWSYILCVIAKMLYLGQLKGEYVASSCIEFLRWGWHPTRFYTFPMHSCKISALYYYGKYAEPLGMSTVPRNFYKQLVQVFKLSIVSNPESYADAVLDRIKEIVQIHFSKRKENLSIQYMIDFLIDEFGKEGFNKEQWAVIEEYAYTRKYSIPFKQAIPEAFERLLDGTKNVMGELETSIIIKLMLREKWNYGKNIQKDADDAICQLLEQYPKNASCFTKANLMNMEDLFSFQPSELECDEAYVLLVRILAERKIKKYSSKCMEKTPSEE